MKIVGQCLRNNLSAKMLDPLVKIRDESWTNTLSVL